MNYDLYQKVLLLPLASTPKGVLRTLVWHCQKDGNTCHPGVNTIAAESGCSTNSVAPCKRLLVGLGVIEFSERTEKYGKGRSPHGYSILLDDTLFYQRKNFKVSRNKWAISSKKRAEFKERIKAVRAEMKQEDILEQEGKPNKVVKPDFESIGCNNPNHAKLPASINRNVASNKDVPINRNVASNKDVPINRSNTIEESPINRNGKVSAVPSSNGCPINRYGETINRYGEVEILGSSGKKDALDSYAEYEARYRSKSGKGKNSPIEQESDAMSKHDLFTECKKESQKLNEFEPDENGIITL